MSRRAAWVAGPLLAAAAVLACAMPGSPPGGEPDRIPPRVLDVVPAMFDTITDLDEPVVIRFNERISEQLQGVAEWDQAVVVSPATSPLEVDAGRRALEISLVRGWEPDRVYRVIVLPVYQDYFDNQRVEPIELIFSTGAPIPDAALAGFVLDRLTGLPIAAARVTAVAADDDAPYVALTDSAGFFAIRYIPGGAYDVRAFVDQDRDREADFFELQDTADADLGVGDTAVVELALLPPDTTPARLARAEPIDSARVRLEFDDYFAPGPVDATARVYSLPDTALVGSGELIHPARLDSILAAEAAVVALREEIEAVRDSLARAAAAPDTVSGEEAPLPELPADLPPLSPEQQDSVEAIARRRLEARRDTAGPSEAPLPARSLILLAPELLEPDSAYEVRVDGVTNIRGVPGGGGTARFVVPRPQPEDTTTVDSLTVPGGDLPAAPPLDTVPPASPPATRPGVSRPPLPLPIPWLHP